MNFHSSGDLYDENEADVAKKLRNLVPTQAQDKVAMFIFLVMCPAIFALVFFGVLPIWYPTFGEAWVLRVVPILYLLFNVYVNYIYVIRVGPSGRDTVLPNVFQAGFRLCHHCNTNAPPRSHHCPVCNICVLRRDHHCSFAAVCIGHFNQRYFCAAVANLFMATLPCFVWTFEWMMDSLEPFALHRVWQLIMPHVALMFRFLTANQFACVGFCALVFTVLMFSAYLMAAQLFCMWNGQTRIEFLMDIHAYQLGFLENIRQSLGTRWFLVWVSPFISSPLPSNGLSYQTRENKFEHCAKSM